MLSRTSGHAPASRLIWAFVPYIVQDGRLNGFDFDTAQTKREMARAFCALNLPWIWQPIVRTNLEAIVQQAAFENPVVLNLCDGITGAGPPGIEVIQALERARIPFTGADSLFYEISTSKLTMKRMMSVAGVPTPTFEAIPPAGPVDGICSRVGSPLLVKPDRSAASGGVFLRSKVGSDYDVARMRDELSQADVPLFCDRRSLLAERFIEGPEFTVFVLGNWRDPASVRSLPPAERVFNSSIPDGEKFLSFERYWGSYIRETPPPDGDLLYSYAACDPRLAQTVGKISREAYIAVRGTGYGRVDLRMDRATGDLFVLEVNANCGLSEDDQTSTGCILKLAGMSLADLLSEILEGAFS